jgi:hypothetical protein
MIIIIDTSSIHGDYFLKRADISRLAIIARRCGHTIFLPEVVLREIKKHYLETLLNSQKEVEKELKNFQRKTGDELPNPITGLVINQHKRKYSKGLKENIKALGISILPLPSEGHNSILDKAILRKKPFKQNGEGYQDALIWASILEVAGQYSDQAYLDSPRIIFVPKNYKDFCESQNAGCRIQICSQN